MAHIRKSIPGILQVLPSFLFAYGSLRNYFVLINQGFFYLRGEKFREYYDNFI